MNLLSNKDNNNKEIQEINLKIIRSNNLYEGIKVFIEELKKEKEKNKNYFYKSNNYNPNNEPCVKKLHEISTKIAKEAASLKQKKEANDPMEINTMEDQFPSNKGAPILPPSYMSHLTRKEGGKSCRKYSKKQRKTRVKKRRSLSH